MDQEIPLWRARKQSSQKASPAPNLTQNWLCQGVSVYNTGNRKWGVKAVRYRSKLDLFAKPGSALQCSRPPCLLASFECSFSGGKKKLKGGQCESQGNCLLELAQEGKKASARQSPAQSEKASEGSDWQREEVLIHQNKRDQEVWASRETGCSRRGPRDETVITKQNSPNKITADNESATKLWNDVRILISIPQRALRQFHKCPFSSLNSKGGGKQPHLAVSKLIMCFISVMPQKQSHCNISSCFGRILIFSLLI